MKKFLLSLFIFQVVIFCETEVYAPIYENTTWEKSCSPYIVRSTIVVHQGARLSIEPGVDVHFGENAGFLISGELVAIGSQEGINFLAMDENKYWQGVRFTSESIKAKFDESGRYLTGSVLENVNIYQSRSDKATIYSEDGSPYVNRCVVENNFCAVIIINRSQSMVKISNCIFSNNSLGGSLIKLYGVERVILASNLFSNNYQIRGDLVSIVSSNEVNILANVLKGNRSKYTVRSILSMNQVKNTTVLSNRFQNNFDTFIFGLLVTKCRKAVLSKNYVNNNKVRNSAIYVESFELIAKNNTITNNSACGIELQSSYYKFNCRINNNNLLNNQSYNLANKTLFLIDATENFWGTTDVGGIVDTIFDYSVDSNYGPVDFNKFLLEKNQDCPRILSKSNQKHAFGVGDTRSEAIESAHRMMKRIAGGKKTRVVSQIVTTEDTRPKFHFCYLTFVILD